MFRLVESRHSTITTHLCDHQVRVTVLEFCGHIGQASACELCCQVTVFVVCKTFSCCYRLTLKAPITAAGDSEYFFHGFSEKIRLDISCESSA